MKNINKAITKEKNNENKIPQLLERLKGPDRSYADLAKATGISPASMTRIKKGDYIPSPTTMKKLTSKEANPQGGVTYEDLMEAAGYESEEKIDIKLLNRYEGANESLPGNLKRAEIPHKRNYGAEFSEYENNVMSSIYKSLVDKEILFRKNKDNIIFRIPVGSVWQPDLCVDMLDGNIKRWFFELKYIPDNGHRISRMMLDDLYEKLLMSKPDEETKISIVINNEQIFQRLKCCEHGFAYRGELSVIYYDGEKKELVEECYLSNYCEGDVTREIYLTNH